MRTQPHPKREEEAGRGSGAQGFRGQGQGSRGAEHGSFTPGPPTSATCVGITCLGHSEPQAAGDQHQARGSWCCLPGPGSQLEAS